MKAVHMTTYHLWRLLLTGIFWWILISNIRAQVLPVARFKHYVDTFNLDYPEHVVNAIDNAHCWQWMTETVPFFECPDKELEKTYYYRWYTFRKHIKQTPVGYVITEFLPDVPWAGKYNTISAPVGHHFYEGRWLRNRQYLNDYAVFWFRHGGAIRNYSGWIADAIYQYYLVAANKQLLTSLLLDVVANYEKWETANRDSTGLFWQLDVRDGMEESIGGNGYRPTINSYMYGDARAIARMAELTSQKDLEPTYRYKANRLKQLIQQQLWNSNDHFFKVLPKEQAATLVGVRELLGYVPWYFNLPDSSYSTAWTYLMDSTCFRAPYGPATAEQTHRRFLYEHRRVCQWNGYSWPFATSQTLTALSNLLNNYQQAYVTKTDFMHLLTTYSQTQRIQLPGGRVVPWIDESLDPFTGDWFTRRHLIVRNAPDKNRGEHYNHSTFNDLVISGLIGIRPEEGNRLVINPLIPAGQWAYFCLDQVNYKGNLLTVLFDKTGKKYGRGKGLMILKNGRKIASVSSLRKITVML